MRARVQGCKGALPVVLRAEHRESATDELHPVWLVGSDTGGSSTVYRTTHTPPSAACRKLRHMSCGMLCVYEARPSTAAEPRGIATGRHGHGHGHGRGHEDEDGDGDGDGDGAREKLPHPSRQCGRLRWRQAGYIEEKLCRLQPYIPELACVTLVGAPTYSVCDHINQHQHSGQHRHKGGVMNVRPSAGQ